jgi:hypothetical protein
MPVEEVETTETVEKTTTKKLAICDGCGVNDSSGETNIYKFRSISGKLDQNLYFCDECLNGENLDPMTERVTTPYSEMTQQSREFMQVSFVSAITCSVLGYAAGGIAGVFGGVFLLAILMGIVGLIKNIVR